MIPSKNCLEFIKNEEGLILKAYKDSVGIWTIGVGSISYEDGTPVRKGDIITEDRAMQLLFFEVKKKAKAVSEVTSLVNLPQNQFDALVSFTYNVGVAGFEHSTVLRLVRANNYDPLIRDAFMMWNKGGGNVLPGLTARRKREADLYFNVKQLSTDVNN